MAREFPVKVKITAKDNASAVVRKTAKKIASTVKNIGFAVGGSAVAVGLALKKITQTYNELYDRVAEVGTLSGGSAEQMRADMLSSADAARAWAVQHRDSAATFAQSVYQMRSAGLDMQQSLEGTRTALTVATATMGDGAAVANVLATVYNTLGNRGRAVKDEMTRLGDALARTQQYFQISNIDQLSEGLKYGISTAKQYGISLEQTLGVIGQLNTMGLQGALAGSAFQTSMAKMSDASKKLGFSIVRTNDGGVDFLATIKAIDEKFKGKLNTPKVQDGLQKAFGQRGVKAISLLLGAIKDTEAGIDAVTKSAGTAAKAQGTIESSGTAAWQRVNNIIDEQIMKLGDKLVPLLEADIPLAIEGIKLAFEGAAIALGPILEGLKLLGLLAENKKKSEKLDKIIGESVGNEVKEVTTAFESGPFGDANDAPARFGGMRGIGQFTPYKTRRVKDEKSLFNLANTALPAISSHAYPAPSNMFGSVPGYQSLEPVVNVTVNNALPGTMVEANVNGKKPKIERTKRNMAGAR